MDADQTAATVGCYDVDQHLFKSVPPRLNSALMAKGATVWYWYAIAIEIYTSSGLGRPQISPGGSRKWC